MVFIVTDTVNTFHDLNVNQSIRWWSTQWSIYIYNIRLKIKPNSVRIRFLSCKIFVLPSTGFELTPLIVLNVRIACWWVISGMLSTY
jgi:hypothetical protein